MIIQTTLEHNLEALRQRSPISLGIWQLNTLVVVSNIKVGIFNSHSTEDMYVVSFGEK